MTYNVDIGLEAANVFQLLPWERRSNMWIICWWLRNACRIRFWIWWMKRLHMPEQGNRLTLDWRWIPLRIRKSWRNWWKLLYRCTNRYGDPWNLLSDSTGSRQDGKYSCTKYRRTFLEHSRIYIFGSEGREKIYIASADFMTRNTLRRVEVAAPVYDEEIKARLLEMFRIMLKDNQQARHKTVREFTGSCQRMKNRWMPRNISMNRHMRLQRPLKSAPSVCPVCQNRTQTYRKERHGWKKHRKRKSKWEKSCLSLLKIP